MDSPVARAGKPSTTIEAYANGFKTEVAPPIGFVGRADVFIPVRRQSTIATRTLQPICQARHSGPEQLAMVGDTG